MFTPDEREAMRAALVSAARADARISGAAHLGSAALGQQDEWSDIDLALCVAPQAELEDVLKDWTTRLYRDWSAVAHLDVRRGEILYRVFLLQNTLQVDLSFWPANEFRPTGLKFQLIFGVANDLRSAPVPGRKDMIGMAWLYALHVRSAMARGRRLQAEYMLSGMRNEVLALECRRLGLVEVQGRGLDDLPQDCRLRAANCFPQSLDIAEIGRAFEQTAAELLSEIEIADPELAARLRHPLMEIAEQTAWRA